MQQRGLFQHCNSEIADVEYFNQFVTFLVSKQIPIPRNALRLRAEASLLEGKTAEAAVELIAGFITHARSLNLSLELIDLYEAEGMRRSVVMSLDTRGLDIPWRHYHPVVLARLMLVDKYLAIEKTPEQEQEALGLLLADHFQKDSEHAFDMLDCLLDRTKDQIFQTMNAFQPIIARIWGPRNRTPSMMDRSMATVEKMLTILHDQYPDDNERYELLLRLINNHFNLNDHSIYATETQSMYFKHLWPAIRAIKDYNHVEFIDRIVTFASECTNSIVAEKALSIFIRQPRMEVANDVVRQLTRRHISDASWCKNFVSMVRESDGLNFLEYYLECFVRHATPDTEEPIEVLREITATPVNRSEVFLLSLRNRTVTDNDEQITVYDFFMRHEDRFPQFVGDIREKEVRVQQERERRQLMPPRMAPAEQGWLLRIVGPVPPHPEQPLPQPRPQPPRARVNLARQQPVHADRQSTHTVAIHRSVSESATRLMERYFPTLETRKSEIGTTLADFSENMKQRIFQAFLARASAKYNKDYPPEIVKFLVNERARDLTTLLKKRVFDENALQDAFEGIVSEDAYQANLFISAIANTPFEDPSSKITLINHLRWHGKHCTILTSFLCPKTKKVK